MTGITAHGIVKKMIVIRFISIFIIILSFSTSGLADIYKYIDEHGTAHFTNVPDNNKYRKIISERTTPGKKIYAGIIKKTSSRYNIEPAIIEAVITAESNWNPGALSKKGAVGLMQLMPATAREMNITDPYDPEENIKAGTRYLRHLLDRFHEDLDMALAAYNAGPSRVEEAGGIPPILETRMYVDSVKTFYKNYSRNRITRIYKVTFQDGTVLYTNTPSPYKNHTLSKF